MNAETLRCSACGKEVRVVRLNKTTLTFGHTRNPGPAMHRVQLARSESAPASRGQGGTPARTEGLRADAKPLKPRARSRSGHLVPEASIRGTTAVSGAAGRARRGGLPPATTPRSARSS